MTLLLDSSVEIAPHFLGGAIALISPGALTHMLPRTLGGLGGSHCGHSLGMTTKDLTFSRRNLLGQLHGHLQRLVIELVLAVSLDL
jgi:hypothetical protein